MLQSVLSICIYMYNHVVYGDHACYAATGGDLADQPPYDRLPQTLLSAVAFLSAC